MTGNFFSPTFSGMMMSKLKTWRRARKLTLKTLSERTGLSVSALCKIERGLTWPGPDTLGIIEKTTRGAVKASDLIADIQEAKRAAG